MTSIWNNVKSSISSVISGIYSTIKDGFDNAVNYVKGLASDAWNWGRDIVSNIIDGLRSMIGSLADSVSNIADTIRSYLHFSVPDVGPLTDFESWMPDFMQGLAKGIERSRGLVSSEISKLTKEMDLEHAIPGMEASIRAMSAGNSGSLGGTVNLSQPIYLDGKAITTLVSQIQYSQGQAAIRNLGTA